MIHYSRYGIKLFEYTGIMNNFLLTNAMKIDIIFFSVRKVGVVIAKQYFVR
jgi:hypothetical protein